jgi:hypothetical protein
MLMNQDMEGRYELSDLEPLNLGKSQVAHGSELQCVNGFECLSVKLAVVFGLNKNSDGSCYLQSAGWFQAGLPFEGEYKPDVGRTPNAASEPTLKILASARGYEMRPGDKR